MLFFVVVRDLGLPTARDKVTDSFAGLIGPGEGQRVAGAFAINGDAALGAVALLRPGDRDHLVGRRDLEVARHGEVGVHAGLLDGLAPGRPQRNADILEAVLLAQDGLERQIAVAGAGSGVVLPIGAAVAVVFDVRRRRGQGRAEAWPQP